MNQEEEKALVEHVTTFPERQKKYAENFDRLEKVIRETATHPEPSPKTIAMLGSIKDDFKTHEQNEDEILESLLENDRRFERVLFGEGDDIGMVKMVKDMHEKLVQANGVVSFFKLFILIGGVSAMLYALFKRVP